MSSIHDLKSVGGFLLIQLLGVLTMLLAQFTAQEYAQEIGKSVSTARSRLDQLIQQKKADSFIRYEDNPLKHSYINYGNIPPVRVRYYFFLEV